MYDCIESRYIFGDDVYIDDYYMDEIWEYIRGFPDYMVSDKGRVWSAKTQKFLKLKSLDDHGHLGVCLYKNDYPYYRYIHRLVAEAFIPNPEEHPIIRHRDDMPFYNAVENLEWGSQFDNIHDCIRNGNNYILTDEDREKSYEKSRTPVKAIKIDDGSILYFKGQGEAAKALNIPQSNIWKVMNKERRSAGGYIFEYYEKENEVL